MSIPRRDQSNLVVTKRKCINLELNNPQLVIQSKTYKNTNLVLMSDDGTEPSTSGISSMGRGPYIMRMLENLITIRG